MNRIPLARLPFVLLALSGCARASSPPDPAPPTPVESANPVSTTVGRTLVTRSPYGRLDPTNLALDGDFEFTGRAGQMPWISFTGDGTLSFETGGRCASGLRCAKLTSGSEIIGWAGTAASGSISISLLAKPSTGLCKAFSAVLVQLGTNGGGVNVRPTTDTPGDTGFCTYQVVTDASAAENAVLDLQVGPKVSAIVDDVVIHAVLAGGPGQPIHGGIYGAYAASEPLTGEAAAHRDALREFLRKRRTVATSLRATQTPGTP